MKRLTCLVVLAVLFALLLLPPFLRRFVSFDLEKVSTKGSNDKVLILNCEKQEEKINTSYLNDKPYNIQYKINGNYTNEEETDNSIIMDLRNYSTIKYQDNKNVTIYKIDVNNIKEGLLTNYLLSINEQMHYYEKIGFTCSRME